MSKSLIEIADSVPTYTPSELQALVEELDRLIGIGRKPFQITPDVLGRCYADLEINARNFLNVPASKRTCYHHDNLLVLGYTEFQAAWHVLRSLGYPDREIKSLDPSALQHLFQVNLKNHQEKFSGFVPQRDTAISAFVSTGFIPAGFYGVVNYRMV